MTVSTENPTRRGHRCASASDRLLLARSLYVRDAFDGRAPSWLQIAKRAIRILDQAEREEQKAEERRARYTRKGDRRPVEAVAKGKATAKKHRRQRSAKRGSARRLAQRAEHGPRLFPREMSATAIVLSALEPGRFYLRSQIRAVCPQLPSGTLEALLGREMVDATGLLERAQNPSWDGIGGTLRPKGADCRPERLSRWRYRLSAAGEAARKDVAANPAAWSVRARWRAGLQRAQSMPQPHSWAAFGGRPQALRPEKAPADPFHA